MIQTYNSDDFTVLLFVVYLMGTLMLLGLIIGCSIKAWMVSAEGQWPQLLREASNVVLVILTGWVLWWDLFHDSQFAHMPRLILTGIALVLGVTAYSKIASDLAGRYKGLRSAKHEVNNLLQIIESSKDHLGWCETRVKELEYENSSLRRELENRTF